MSSRPREWGFLLLLLAVLAGFPLALFLPMLVMDLLQGTADAATVAVQLLACVGLAALFMTFGDFLEKALRRTTGRVIASAVDTLVTLLIIWAVISIWALSSGYALLTTAASTCLFVGYSLAIRDVFERLTARGES